MMTRKSLLLLPLFAMIMAGCSKDTPENTTPDSPSQGTTVKEPTTGDMTFTTTGSEATAAHPATATAGHPAEVILSQQCSYNDVDGSTYRCEPKAVVRMTTETETVRAKTLAELTNIQQSIQQSQTGTNPVTHQAKQTFTVGGQTVTFSLSHEVYTYTTSQQTQIQMPFILLSAAKNGQATTTETRAGVANVAVTGISLTPITATRGTYTTEQAYRVQVSFTVDAEARNTEKTAKQTLSFEADYTAVVESTHEYPEPALTYSYKLDVLGGTASVRSPFMLTKGQTLQLQWPQVAQYTWFSMDELQTKVVTLEPKAMMNLSAAKDTIWIDHVEDLDNISPVQSEVTTSGDNPAVTHGKSIFTLGKQNLTLNWSYEAYADLNAEDESVKMPYLQLSEPQVVSINKQELADATISGKKAKVYEVTVRLSQKLTTVNASNPISEAIVYVVKYTAMMEVKLVKVTYRKAWDWVEAHDNMDLASYAKVYRDRTYSTGETFTDMFSNYGHFPDWARAMNPSALEGQEVTWGDNKISYSYVTNTSIGDSIYFSTQSTGVPDISKVCFLEYTDRGYGEFPSPGTWDAYHLGKSYINQDISLQNIEVKGADNISSQPSGWYWWEIAYDNGVVLYYNDQECPLWDIGYVLAFLLRGGFVDEYLVLDGHMFTFLEHRGPFNFDYREEPITMPNGKPAKVITFDVHNTYLGKNFYGAIVDTVYQNK